MSTRINPGARKKRLNFGILPQLGTTLETLLRMRQQDSTFSLLHQPPRDNSVTPVRPYRKDIMFHQLLLSMLSPVETEVFNHLSTDMPASLLSAMDQTLLHLEKELHLGATYTSATLFGRAAVLTTLKSKLDEALENMPDQAERINLSLKLVSAELDAVSLRLDLSTTELASETAAAITAAVKENGQVPASLQIGGVELQILDMMNIPEGVDHLEYFTNLASSIPSEDELDKTFEQLLNQPRPEDLPEPEDTK